MKHKRFLTAALAAVMGFTLSGCQLAQEGAGTESGGDRLIGAFVARDSFSLDELALTGGKNVHVEQGRLYATVEQGETVLTTFYAKDDISIAVQYTDLIWGVE